MTRREHRDRLVRSTSGNHCRSVSRRHSVPFCESRGMPDREERQDQSRARRGPALWGDERLCHFVQNWISLVRGVGGGLRRRLPGAYSCLADAEAKGQRHRGRHCHDHLRQRYSLLSWANHSSSLSPRSCRPSKLGWESTCPRSTSVLYFSSESRWPLLSSGFLAGPAGECSCALSVTKQRPPAPWEFPSGGCEPRVSWREALSPGSVVPISRCFTLGAGTNASRAGRG